MRKAASLSSRERTWIAALAAVVLFLIHVGLARGAWERTKNMTRIRDRVAFSGTSLIDPEVQPALAFDKKPGTAWIEGAPSTLRISQATVESLPDPGTLFLQTEVALSHFPGDPPRPNPLKRLWIWPGLQKDLNSFYAYARPARIRVRFFQQELVDIDREFRLPNLPEPMGETTVVLEDKPGPQIIDLTFLPKPAAVNTPFPQGIHQIWLRIEIETLYPGLKHTSSAAISEIYVEQEIPVEAQVGQN
ncbi:MAG: hypothetical protein HY042_04760 [Spirochaetia bacterium]|nr:hypothetical protein [Spirochaetia bacterium]